MKVKDRFIVFKFIVKRYINSIYNFINKKLEQSPRSTLFCLGLLNVVASTPFSFFPVLFFTFYFTMQKFNDTEDRMLKFKFISYFIGGHFLGQFHWLLVPLFVTFEVFFWLIPFALVGIPIAFVLIKSVFMAPLCFFSNHIPKTKNGKFVFSVLFVFSWLGGEFIRTDLLFGNGFTWMHFGHYFDLLPFMQIHRFICMKTYSLMFFLLVLTPYFSLKIKTKPSKILAAVVCVFWMVSFCFGCYVLIFEEPMGLQKNLMIAGSQSNFKSRFSNNLDKTSQNIKDSLRSVSFVKYHEGNALALLPESGLPFPIKSGSQQVVDITEILPKNGLLMSGSFYIDEDGKPYNVIEAYSPNGIRVARYAKSKLVPFGEYMPFRRFLPKWVTTVAGDLEDFQVIPDRQNDTFFFYRNFPVLMPLVCYEAIFADDIRSKVLDFKRQNGEQDVLAVNLTNDSWERRSIGLYQHFLMSRFSAIRAGTPIARLSNNGISAVIDKHGATHSRTPADKASILFYLKK